MAIEALPKELQYKLDKALRDDDNTYKGCSISIVDNQVHVKIPIKNTSDFNTYIFSKRDVKALFEGLYTS